MMAKIDLFSRKDLKKATEFLSFAVLIGFAGISFSAMAQESIQPYIDSIKEGLEEEGPFPAQGSYIESLRNELGKDPYGSSSGFTEDLEESYTERMRRELSRSEDERPQPSYTDELKRSIGAAPEGSAIEDLKLGRSELKLNRPGRIRNAFGFRVGASQKRNISGPNGKSFSSTYGDNWAPDLTVQYEYQPFRSERFGSIGIVGGVGVTYHHGHGQFQVPVPLRQAWPGGGEFNRTSRTRLKFNSYPVTLGVNYRLNLLHFIRPYVQATPAFIAFREGRDDGLSAKLGYSTGYVLGGGVNILLDFLSRKSTWSLYDHHGVKRYYLTLDYSRMETLSGDVDFSVSGMSVGFTFEL